MPKPQYTVSKAKNLKKSLLDLLKYSKSYIFLIIISMIFIMGSTLITIFAPNKVGDLANLISYGIEGEFDLDAIIQLIKLLAILYVSASLLNYLVNFIMATVTAKVSKRLRTDIFSKINRVPLRYFDRVKYGDILSRITNDVDTISQTLNNSISSLISSVVTIVGCLVIMFVTNPIMATTSIVSTIIGFVLVAIILSKSQKYFVVRQKSLGNLNGYIEEVYTNHSVVKLYNGEHITKNKFDKLNVEVREADRKSQFYSGLMGPLMGFVSNLGFVAVAIVGTMLVINGSATIGTIITFMIFVRLFSNPLSQLAQCLTNLQATGAASERVFEFLREEELTDESKITQKINPSKVSGSVEFKHVKFGYNKDKTIINDFSVKINSGNKVAIVGPTGAGKTTIVNLLMKFYDIDDGDILIDGKSIKNLTRENVHDLFGMVLQDTWLFNGTIRENLVFDKENVSDETIIEACKACGIDHFIRSLPNGYDSVLSDATTISAGQKQLLTIARAMIQNSPMLILDEATSNVDTRTETLIQIAMDKLTHNRTSFVIAHRLSTIKNADIILVMNNGDIVEVGDHNTLLLKNGFYAELYNSQFEE